MLELPYGSRPYPIEPGPAATVLAPAPLPVPPPLAALLDAALAAPFAPRHADPHMLARDPRPALVPHGDPHLERAPHPALDPHHERLDALGPRRAPGPHRSDAAFGPRRAPDPHHDRADPLAPRRTPDHAFATLDPRRIPGPRASLDPAGTSLAPGLQDASRAIGLRLADLVRPGDRVTIIVSDATRHEPRRAFLEALARHLPPTHWTIAIATGTHGPSPIAPLDLPTGIPIINHDGHRADDLVDLGVTARGTPIRVHRAAVETDLVIATGCIRPHYFAGFGAGAKAIFPGLGEAAAIRINHALKTEPGARAGVVDANPCRADLEDAVTRIPAPTFLLNAVMAPDGLPHAAVAGDLRGAFRAGADLARGWFGVRAPRADLVIASDALPVTASLYQAAKIAAAVAPLVADGGTLLLVAECADGIEPLAVVNEAIFRIGVLPRLPPGASIRLVSSLDPADVARTLVGHAPSVDAILRAHAGRVLVVPRASQLICEPS